MRISQGFGAYQKMVYVSKSAFTMRKNEVSVAEVWLWHFIKCQAVLTSRCLSLVWSPMVSSLYIHLDPGSLSVGGCIKHLIASTRWQAVIHLGQCLIPAIALYVDNCSLFLFKVSSVCCNHSYVLKLQFDFAALQVLYHSN